jgi:hypothetical protein
MDTFALGIMVGMAFGLVLMGILSLGAYDRGFDAATHRRVTWLSDALRHRMGSGEKGSVRRIA